MKRSTDLYKVSVLVTQADEEPVTGLLQELFGVSPCVETDLTKGTTSASVYLNQRPARGPLKAVLPCFSIRKLRRENWAESWKRHFKPLEIGSELLIKPGWSRRKPKPGQASVVLDPGLSFGTGQHPTTRFCLEQITKFSREAGRRSFLDVGTGSGILAIAAAKLGYLPIDAFDFDPAAVRIAQANARKNRVSKKVWVWLMDVTNHPLRQLKYDMICANLIADLLVSELGWFIERLKPGGWLVIAGILKLQFGEVEKAYEKAGFRMIASRIDKEWRSGAFEFPRKKIPEK